MNNINNIYIANNLIKKCILVNQKGCFKNNCSLNIKNFSKNQKKTLNFLRKIYSDKKIVNFIEKDKNYSLLYLECLGKFFTKMLLTEDTILKYFSFHLNINNYKSIIENTINLF